MEKFLNWLNNNKEWLFSGIGVTIIFFIIIPIFKLIKTEIQKETKKKASKDFDIKEVIENSIKNKGNFNNKSMSGKITFNYSSNNGSYIIGDGEYVFETKWSKASDLCIYAYSDGATIEKIGYKKGINYFPKDCNKLVEMDYTSRCQTVYIGEIVVWLNKNEKFAITRVLSIKDNSRSDDEDELCFEYIIYN